MKTTTIITNSHKSKSRSKTWHANLHAKPGNPQETTMQITRIPQKSKSKLKPPPKVQLHPNKLKPNKKLLSLSPKKKKKAQKTQNMLIGNQTHVEINTKIQRLSNERLFLP